FALGDVYHLLCSDAGARPFKLGHWLAIERPPGLRRARKAARQMLAADIADFDWPELTACVFFDSAAVLDTFYSYSRQAFMDVDCHVGIGVGTCCVVYWQRRLAGRCVEHDLAQGHAQITRGFGLRIDLARSGQRTRGDFRDDQIGAGDWFVHDHTPER